MILSAVVCAFSSSGESGVSENLNIVEPIHNSGAVFVVAVLSRQLSSTVDNGSSVSGIFFLAILVLWSSLVVRLVIQWSLFKFNAIFCRRLGC